MNFKQIIILLIVALTFALFTGVNPLIAEPQENPEMDSKSEPMEEPETKSESMDEPMAEETKSEEETVYDKLYKASDHLRKASKITKLEHKLKDLKAAQEIITSIEDEYLSEQLNIARYTIWDARKTIKLYQLLVERQEKIDKERMKNIEERVQNDIDKALDDINHYYGLYVK